MKKLVVTAIKALLSKKISRKMYSALSRNVLRDNKIRHFMPSIAYSREDIVTTVELVDLVADAVKIAAKTELNCGKADLPDSPYLNVFPGEHYRLINAIAKASKAKKVVEIGTYTGMGTLSLKAGLPDISVVTYDVIKWDSLGVPSHFNSSDFNENLCQIIGDLSQDEVFEENFDILNDADIIFMDAPKDDRFEYAMAEKLSTLTHKKFRILILDDIQFVNMIDFWRKIKSPKLDITSFGHFSGTGIVDISNGLDWR